MLWSIHLFVPKHNHTDLRNLLPHLLRWSACLRCIVKMTNTKDNQTKTRVLQSRWTLHRPGRFTLCNKYIPLTYYIQTMRVLNLGPLSCPGWPFLCPGWPLCCLGWMLRNKIIILWYLGTTNTCIELVSKIYT